MGACIALREPDEATALWLAPARARYPSTMPSAAALDERPRDLDARFAQGDDASALREAYEAHGALVFSLCLRGLPTREEAEDAVQQVFVAAWRARRRFDPTKGTLGGWLAGIARNKVLDAQRALYRRRDVLAIDPDADVEAPDGAPATSDAVTDQLVVRAALDRLAPERRSVLELSFFEGLPHPEIAERTGLPLGTVKSHIRRGLDALRADLEASDG